MLSKVYKFKFLLAMMLVPFLVSAQPPGWGEPTNTLFTHNLVIPATVTPEINGTPLATGDYVGVFFNDGGMLVCGGLVEYTAGLANAFSAFGNDPLTPGKDGFFMGETLIWRAYVVAGNESYWADVTYAVGPSVFTTFGYSEIGTFDGPSFAVTASASPDLFCGVGGNVTLTGTQLAGEPVVSWDWYDNAVFIGSGQVLVVPNVEESTTFRLEASDGLLTSEAFVNVTVIAASAGEGQHLCDVEDEIQLNGSATGFVGLNWTTSGTGTFSNPGILNPIYFPSEADKTDGVTLTMNVITLDCGPFSDEIEFTFEASPYVNIIPDQDYVCFGDSYDFAGLVEAGNYAELQWFTTNGSGIFTPNEEVLEPVYQPSTLDYLQGCIEIGVAASPNLPCTVSDEDFIILCFVSPPEAFAGDPVMLCDDEAVTYTFADAVVTFDPVYGGEILWTTTGDGTFDNATLENPTYTFGTMDLYGGLIEFTLTATTLEACDPAVSTTTISIQASPTINILQDEYLICEGEDLDFTGEVETNGEYSAIQWVTTNGSGFFSPSETVLEPTYVVSTLDYLTYANGECIELIVIASPIDPCTVSADDMTLLCFQMLPVVVAGEDATVCSHEIFTTDPTVENSDGPYMWTVDPADAGTFADPTALVTDFDPNPDYEGMTVQLMLTAYPISPCAEPQSGVMNLYIEYAPWVNAGPDMTICETESATIEGECAHVAFTMWATTGDGYFECPDFSCEQVEYFPGPGDIANGCVTLVLIGYPLDPCTLWVLDKMKLCFEPAPFVDAGDDQTVCQGEDVQLDATAEDECGLQWVTFDGTGTFSNETILNPVYTPSFQDVITGTVHLTLIAAGCDPCNYSVESTVALTIQWGPDAFVGEGGTVCEDGFVLADATASYYSSLLWTTGGDGTFNDETALNPVYTPGAGDIAAGMVELCLTAEPIDPCTVAATDCAIFQIQGLPTIDIIPDEDTICFGDVYDFTGKVIAGNYSALQWFTTNGAGAFSPSETVLEPTYQPSTLDYLQGCITIGVVASPLDPCTVAAEDFMTLCFQAPPEVNAGDDATVCEDATFTVAPEIENGGTVLWTTSGDGSFDDPTMENATYTPGPDDIAGGYVMLCIEVQGLSTCDAVTDCFTLFIQALPVAYAGDDATICEQLCIPPWTNGTLELSGMVENACGSMWETAGDGTFDDSGSLYAVYTLGVGDIAAGTVVLTLHALPCDPCTVHGLDELTITVQPFPMADAGEDQVICEGDDAQLDGYAENHSGVFWDYALLGEGDGTFSSKIILNPVYTPGPEDIELGWVELIMVAFPIDPCTYPDADIMTLTITPAPVANAGGDATICEGETYYFADATAENADYVVWTTAGDGTFDDPSLVNPTYTPGMNDIAAGGVEICIEAFDGSECDHIEFKDCMFLTINPPPVVYAGPDATICEYESFTLADATEDNTSGVMWSTSGDGYWVPEVPNVLNPTYYPGEMDKANGSVELTLTGFPNEPCSLEATDSMTLFINAEPIIGFCFNDVLAEEGSEFEFCFDEVVTVSLCEVWAGVGPFTIVYEVNGLVETIVVNEGENLFSDLLAPGDYVIQVISITDANGCMSQNVEPYVAYITINPEPVAAFCFNGELAETGSVFEYCYDVLVDVTLCAIVEGEGPFEVCYSINGEPEVCVTVAEGESLFTDLLTAGTYNIVITSITDANGCAADVTPYMATVIVHPEPAVLFDFNGEIASTGSIFEFCYDEIITVTLFEVLLGDEPFDLEWTVNGTPYSANGVMEGDELFSEMLEPGTYVVVITSIIDANGCEVANPEDIYYATVIVNEEPVAAFCINGELADTGSVFEFCYDEEVDVTLCGIIAGVGPFEVCYSINGEPEVCVTVLEGESLFTGVLDPGTYNIQITSITDANGCGVADVSPYMATVIINPEPILEFAFNGVPAGQGFTETYCEGTPVVITVHGILSGIGPFEVCYSINGEPEVCVTVANIGDVLFNAFLEPGVYTFEVTSLVDLGSDLNCAASDATLALYTAIITIQAGPTAQILTEDDVVCEDGTITLFGEVTNYSTFYWTGDGVADPFSLLTTFTPTPDQIAAGEAVICLVAEPIAPCTVNAEDCITITIYSLPTVDAGDDVTVCNSLGSTVDITGVATSYSSVLWSYDIGTYGFIGDFVPANALETTFTVDVLSGFDVIEICLLAEPIDPCTTVVEDCINLYFQAPPVADAGDDALICEGDSYQLDGYVENESSFAWSTAGDGTFDNMYLLDAVYTPGAGDIANGGVILTLTAFDGPCEDGVDEMFLQIVPVPTIVIEPEIMLGCEHYDFIDSEWLPIEVCALVANAEFVQWSTDGDGFFDDPTAACTNYNLGDNDKWAQVITLTLEAIGPGNCGFVAVAEVLLHVPTQLIVIDNPTWWGISSYVDKTDTSVPDVMYPAVGPGPGSEDLVIMINKGGQYYWPEPTTPINQLGNWLPIGYKAKFKNETCIPIYGDVLTDLTFEVGGPSLFTYVPVLTNVPVNVNTLFGANLNNVLLIYDWDTGVFWTEDTPFDLTEFLPGKAYLLVRKAGAPVFDITFPAFDPNEGPGAKIAGVKSVFGSNAVWNDVVNTSNPHFIMFSKTVSNMMQPGDIIGAFNYLDECVGVAAYGSKDQAMKLAVMGDDPITDIIDGFEAGENMTFKLYRPSTDETFEVTFTYDLEYPNYDNTYELYGASRVVDMTMTATSVGSVPADLSVTIFPNPARDVINIVSDYEIKSVSLVNYVGQTVYSRNVTGNNFQIDVATYATGMYMLRLETTDGSLITKRIAVE